MKKVIILLLATFCLSQTSISQEKRVLTLEEVIELARTQSRNAKQAETSRNLGYWSFNVYSSQLRPQLLLRGTLPNITDRATPVTQENGEIDFVSVNQNNSNLSLGLEQVLPWTNTTIALETNLARFDNYTTDITRYQGDPFGITLTQPLFNVNPFKWDKITEPLEYEQSKRQYVQSLESTSQRAAQLFFQVLEEQMNLQIEEQNEAASDTINKVEQGRYNIGTSTEDEVLQTQLDLITAQSGAQQARLDLQTSSLELRNFINITDDVQLELIPPADVPNLAIDYETALQYAKDNRAEYLDFKLDRLNAERQVAEARALRFSATVRASFGYNSISTDALRGVYRDDNLATGSTFRLDFALPILDGGRNKARMRVAREQLQLAEFNIEQGQITFEQEIAIAVRNFQQIRSQIEIALKRQEIALKRFEITNGRYLAGKVDILALVNARTTKDSALRSYITALRQYWNAYYELRALTLYDFEESKLLYNPLLDYDPKTNTMVEKTK
ncbi:TolC family protein [Roseivirga misakiensis]|uniref:Transporter n=1 Tax=Roseivirga misakiensis TaxID=1563681 RepID=A0A1E5SK01_9BACT|nr:TolC family protein [Roseivirga misakiensis]OEJ99454.1 hypothetical protein BFP71_07660 [Roseivirga misakiensis]